MSTKKIAKSNTAFKLFCLTMLGVIVVIYAILNGIEIESLFDVLKLILNYMSFTTLNAGNVHAASFGSVPLFLMPGDTIKMRYAFDRVCPAFSDLISERSRGRARCCVRDILRTFRAWNLAADDRNWSTVCDEIQHWSHSDFLDPAIQRCFRRVAKNIRVRAKLS
jgi:hypothetical protein